MWTFEGQEQTVVPAGMIGFVYCITNETNGRKYIGKKGYFFSKTKQVKLKKKKVKVESDWQTYFGSNDALIADVEKYGPDNFSREILYQCKGKGEMGYWEAYEQFNRHVLLSDQFYNGWISAKVSRSHVKALYAAV